MQRWIARCVLPLVVFAAALAAGLPATTNNRHAKAAACSEIVAGAVLSLTGEHSAGGNDVRNGYEFAIRRLNERGGIRLAGRCYNLRIIYHDDESSTDRAAELAERLIRRDNVRFLLGPYGLARAEAVAAVATRREVPLIAIEGHVPPPGASPARRFVFPLLPSPNEALSGFADYVAHLAAEIGREPGDLRIAVVTEAARADGGARALLHARSRKHGLGLMFDEEFDREPGDLSQLLARVKAERPDVLLIDAHAAAARRALAAIEEMAVEVPVLAMTNCESARLTRQQSTHREHLLCLSGWGADLGTRDDLLGRAAVFENELVAARRAAGASNAMAPVPAQTAYAATAVRVLAAAIEAAGTPDHFQVRDALARISVETLVGRVTFRRWRLDQAAPPLIRQIVRGRYVPVWPPRVATDTYRWPRVPNGPF